MEVGGSGNSATACARATLSHAAWIRYLPTYSSEWQYHWYCDHYRYSAPYVNATFEQLFRGASSTVPLGQVQASWFTHCSMLPGSRLRCASYRCAFVSAARTQRRSDCPPIRHHPDNAAWACHLHKLPTDVSTPTLLIHAVNRNATHLLMPAEEHTHSLPTTFRTSEVPPADLREACRLRCDVSPCCGVAARCWALPHALI